MKKGLQKLCLLTLLGIGLISCGGEKNSDSTGDTGSSGSSATTETVSSSSSDIASSESSSQDITESSSTSEGTSSDSESETPVTVLTVTEALEKEDGTNVVVQGTVSKITYSWSSDYKNMSIILSDGTNEIACYKLGTQVKRGAVIKVTGTMGTHSNARQIAEGATAETITDPVPEEMSISSALESDNLYKTVTLKGTVISIDTAWSSQYKNISVTIADESAKMYIYRLKTNVELGNVITATGILSTYNGNVQLTEATATIDEGATVVVTGLTAVESLSLETTKTGKLNANVTPLNASNQGLTYESSNTEIATVDSTGKVTAVSAGTANITITTSEGSFTKVVPVTVTAPSVTYTKLATFNMGTDNSSKNESSNVDGTGTTSYSETDGDYTLSITDGVCFYTGAYDNLGGACLKLGTGSKAGSFKFIAPDGVDKVVISVAGYKAKTCSIAINGGTDITIETLSTNGQYTDVDVDTTETKEISFAVTSGYRCKITAISYYSIDK